jgi:hypothetical protein
VITIDTMPLLILHLIAGIKTRTLKPRRKLLMKEEIRRRVGYPRAAAFNGKSGNSARTVHDHPAIKVFSFTFG